MQTSKHQKTSEAAQEIGSEILSVIARALGNPGLVPFVQGSGENHDAHYENQDLGPIRVVMLQAIEKGG